MIQYLRSFDSFLGWHQASRNKIFCSHTDSFWNYHIFLHDVVHDLPIFFARKRSLASEKNNEYNTKGPNIAWDIILWFDNLGRDVINSPYHRFEFVGCGNSGGKAKISQFEYWARLSIQEQEIFRLQISMAHISGMQIRDSFSNIPEHFLGLVFRHPIPIFDPTEQFPALTVLHHQVYIFVRLIGLVQLHQIGMVKLLHQPDLSHQSSGLCYFILPDHFDGSY